MRKEETEQLRFECMSIDQLQLNLNCRDEIIPLLVALQYVYGNAELRGALICLVANDVNESSSRKVGREGLTYWQILVLAVVRLGMNVDYDKLQDLCENHRSLRCVLQVGGWDDETNFSWRRLRDTICLLKPATLKEINTLLVQHGHSLAKDAAETVRADSFVIETNIHYPTDSSLIWDGVRKLVDLATKVACLIDAPGWRQAPHLKHRVKEQVRKIARLSASKSLEVKRGLKPAYAKLCERAGVLLDRARALKTQADTARLDPALSTTVNEFQRWIDLTVQVVDTAFRRTQLDEKVPNDAKIFSLFEAHTQLYRRGKAAQPNQFGRMALIYEDGAGFISHYHLMHRSAQDAGVVVAETKTAARVHCGRIRKASFDRGFHSPDNESQLAGTIDNLCMPPRHPGQYIEWLKNASVVFREARQNHPGIESAIGALQAGNGLKRCRDRSEFGLERYLGLAVLGRNMHTLGKLLIRQTDAQSDAAQSRRAA